MRKRYVVQLAASGKWPDAGVSSIGFPFNWVKVDNRGATDVDVSLTPPGIQGDLATNYLTVKTGKVRVFNLAGPKNSDDTPYDEWPNQIWLVCGSGGSSTVMLEVADCPIVDMEYRLESGTVAQVVNTSTGAAAQQNANLGGVTGLTPVVTKVMILGLGATSATTVNATLTGTISPSTINIPVTVPAGVTTAITPVVIDFGTGIPCSAVGGTITLTVPSFGSGNTQEEAIIIGYFQ